MDDLRARIAETLRDVRYQSQAGRGNRGFMPHHIEAITEAMVALLGEPVGQVGLGVDSLPVWSTAKDVGYPPPQGKRVVPLYAITSEEPEDA